MIKYRYAIGNDGNSVDVSDLTKETRRKNAPYICYGCGKELIPNLGKKKVKHFSHMETCECSVETYLHELGKLTFIKEYKDCLTNEQPFLFTTENPAVCTYYKDLINETCENRKLVEFDLTKVFKIIILETHYKGFVPDILLLSDDKSDALFIEIVVTHESEKEKIDSGYRIIEILLKGEADIDTIRGRKIFEYGHNITTYNLDKKLYTGNVCNGDCKKRLNVFMVHHSGKCILIDMPIKDALVAEQSEICRYFKLLGLAADDDKKQRNLFVNLIREAHFSGVQVKNCYMCKYHGWATRSKTIFCKLLKTETYSNDATKCNYYRIFKNMNECERADKNNKDYWSYRGFDVVSESVSDGPKGKLP